MTRIGVQLLSPTETKAQIWGANKLRGLAEVESITWGNLLSQLDSSASAIIWCTSLPWIDAMQEGAKAKS